MAAIHISTELRDEIDQRILEYEHGFDGPAGPEADCLAWTERTIELLYEIQAVTE